VDDGVDANRDVGISPMIVGFVLEVWAPPQLDGVGVVLPVPARLKAEADEVQRGLRATVGRLFSGRWGEEVDGGYPETQT
jgi:hypothetical protein